MLWRVLTSTAPHVLQVLGSTLLDSLGPFFSVRGHVLVCVTTLASQLPTNKLPGPGPDWNSHPGRDRTDVTRKNGLAGGGAKVRGVEGWEGVYTGYILYSRQAAHGKFISSNTDTYRVGQTGVAGP